MLMGLGVKELFPILNIERYNRVAALLVTLAKSQELVIDVGCGVGFWSTLMAKHEPVWLVWINCQGFFKSVGGELNG